MVVGADEAGQDDLACPVDDPHGAGVRRFDLGAWTDRGDTVVLHVYRAIPDDAILGVYGEYGGVGDEQAHVSLRAIA